MVELEPMRDHWWWRPGWRIGRSAYTWHITFTGQPQMERLVANYAPLLNQLAQLDPVPPRWLHLTVQGVGFADEVDGGDVARIVDAVTQQCASVDPFRVTVGPADVDAETIQMPVRPVEPLASLRGAIRDGIGAVWGNERVPEPLNGFRPHVTLGYSNQAGPAEPIAEALARHPRHSADITIDAVSLIELNRDSKQYQWVDVATVQLGR